MATRAQCISSYTRRAKISTNLSSSRRMRQVQNTTSCHNSGTMNLHSIRIGTVRGYAPYKHPPRNTMPKSPGTNSNPLRIFCSSTFFSHTVETRAQCASRKVYRLYIWRPERNICRGTSGDACAMCIVSIYIESRVESI